MKADGEVEMESVLAFINSDHTSSFTMMHIFSTTLSEDVDVENCVEYR